MLSLDANKSITGEALSFFAIIYNENPFISKFLFSRFSISIFMKYLWDMCRKSQLFCALVKTHIRCTSSILIDFTLPILLLAQKADMLSIWIIIWLLNSFENNAFKANLAASSYKILMFCGLSSVENCPHVLFCFSDAHSQVMKCQCLLW